MLTPFLVTSDLHYHPWSAFAKASKTGINSRLQIIIDQSAIAHEALKSAGGNVSFIAGDVFHVRGTIAPDVLNPVMDHYRELIQAGHKIYAIPGNHDLMGNDASRVSNAITALEAVGVVVAHEPTLIKLDDGRYVALFPWFSTPGALCDAMRAFRATPGLASIDGDNLTAIIHAPIDRVLPHLPDHGLQAGDLASLGYGRVLSGHYHHHCDMGRGVYSIGALTHQTWGDVGSKAGYLLVGDRITQHTTTAPKFVDVTGNEDADDLGQIVAGNYVRVRAEVETDTELESIRADLIGMGALGVQIMATKKTIITRSGAAVATSGTGGMSIEGSIADFTSKRSMSPAAHTLCLDILSEARAAE